MGVELACDCDGASSVPAANQPARVYPYAGEDECEANLRTFLDAVRAVHSTTPDGFAAIKVTALGDPALLERVSSAVVALRAFYATLEGGRGELTREQFIETVERGLAQGHPLMPAPMQRVVERMTAGRWLWMYADLDGLERVLWMMSQRFTQRFGRRVQLGSAVAVVERDYAGFAEDFELLMPALIQAVREAGDDPANPQPGGTL